MSNDSFEQGKQLDGFYAGLSERMGDEDFYIVPFDLETSTGRAVILERGQEDSEIIAHVGGVSLLFNGKGDVYELGDELVQLDDKIAKTMCQFVGKLIRVPGVGLPEPPAS